MVRILLLISFLVAIHHGGADGDLSELLEVHVPNHRQKAAVSVQINVKLIGISTSDVPPSRLQDILQGMQPVFTVQNVTKTDVSLVYRYSVNTLSVSVLQDFDDFIRSSRLEDGIYHVKQADLSEYLRSLEDVKSSLHRFSVIIVHSVSLPRHIIYAEDERYCTQSIVTHSAILDLSATPCGVPELFVPQSSHLQYLTPIFDHPWPGTFATDSFTLWNHIPFNDIQNHRLARLASVVASAAKIFGATNFYNLEIDSSKSFFIPVICFKNGNLKDHLPVNIDSLNQMLDSLLPIGHKGHILAITHHINDHPSVRSAISLSERVGFSQVKQDDGSVATSEYYYYDTASLWERLSDSVDQTLQELIHTLRLSNPEEKRELSVDSMRIYPIIVLSNFHYWKEELGAFVMPLLSNRDVSFDLRERHVHFVLHSDAMDVTTLHKDSSGDTRRWSSVDWMSTNHNTLIARGMVGMVAGLTQPHYQLVESSNVIDLTWAYGSHPFGKPFGQLFPGTESYDLGVWAARRGIVLSRLHRLLVHSNSFVTETYTIIAKYRNLELASSECELFSLGDLLSDIEREQVYNDLPAGSAYFPLISKISYPVEVQETFHNMEVALAEMESIGGMFEWEAIWNSGGPSSYEKVIADIERYESELVNIMNRITEEHKKLAKLMRECSLDYVVSNKVSQGGVTSQQDGTEVKSFKYIIFLAIAGVLSIVLVSVFYLFIKYVEAKAKKIA